MSDPKKTFREERRYGEGPSGYVVRFYWDLAEPADVQPYWIDFEIHQIACCTMEDIPQFYSTEDQEHAKGLTFDIAEAFPMCNGFVKWDGCTQIYFAADRNTPALHFDEADDMRMFFECLTYARERASAVMPEYS